MLSRTLLAALGTALIFVFCDSMSAYWAKKGSVLALVVMAIFAPIGYVCFGLLSNHVTLSAASGLVNMFLLLGTVLVGVYVFNDTLSTRQYLGLGFAIVAILLLAKK